MKRKKWISLFVFGGVLLISNISHAQLLKGVIKADSIPELQIAYTPHGDLLSTEYYQIKPDKDGNFTFDKDLLTQTNDVGVYVGEEIFGAHVEKGKTTSIYLERKSGAKNFGIKFSEDNADLSEIYSAYS